MATVNPDGTPGELTFLQQIEGISVGLNPNVSDRHPFIDHKKTYFAPRFGFAWQPFGMKDWSVRGGAGVFFDRGGNTNWSDTETANPPIDWQLQRQHPHPWLAATTGIRALPECGLPI